VIRTIRAAPLWAIISKELHYRCPRDRTGAAGRDRKEPSEGNNRLGFPGIGDRMRYGQKGDVPKTDCISFTRNDRMVNTEMLREGCTSFSSSRRTLDAARNLSLSKIWQRKKNRDMTTQRSKGRTGGLSKRTPAGQLTRSLLIASAILATFTISFTS
jgi:hypothetical protein